MLLMTVKAKGDPLCGQAERRRKSAVRRLTTIPHVASSQFKHETNPRELVVAESLKLFFAQPALSDQSGKHEDQN